MEIDPNIKCEMVLALHSPTATERCDHEPISTVSGRYRLTPRSHRLEYVVDAFKRDLKQPRRTWSPAKLNALTSLEAFFRSLRKLDEADEQRYRASNAKRFIRQTYRGSAQHRRDFPGFDWDKDPGDDTRGVGDRMIKALDNLFFSGNLSTYIVSRPYSKLAPDAFRFPCLGATSVLEDGINGKPFAVVEYSLRDGETDAEYSGETRVEKAASIMFTICHEMAHCMAELFWCPKCCIKDVTANIGTRGASGHGPGWVTMIRALRAECLKLFFGLSFRGRCLSYLTDTASPRGAEHEANELMSCLNADYHVDGLENGMLSLMLERMEEFILLMRDIGLLEEARDKMWEVEEWNPMDTLDEKVYPGPDPIDHMNIEEKIARIRLDVKYLHYFTFVGSWEKIIKRVKTQDMSLKTRFIDFMADLELVQKVEGMAKLAWYLLPERSRNLETMTEQQLHEAMAQIILDLLDRNGMVFHIGRLLRSSKIPYKKRHGQTRIVNHMLVATAVPEYDWNSRFQKIFAP